MKKYFEKCLNYFWLLVVLTANSWNAEYDTWLAFQAATQWGPTKYVQW